MRNKLDSRVNFLCCQIWFETFIMYSDSSHELIFMNNQFLAHFQLEALQLVPLKDLFNVHTIFFANAVYRFFCLYNMPGSKCFRWQSLSQGGAFNVMNRYNFLG